MHHMQILEVLFQAKALQWWQEWLALKRHHHLLGERRAQHLLKMSLWAWQHFMHQHRLRKIAVPQLRAAQQSRSPLFISTQELPLPVMYQSCSL